MNNITFEKLERLCLKFSSARILVIGDIIVDKYIWGKVNRISPEAPVPIVNVEKETFSWGGAANVAQNIKSLGGGVALAGALGNDSIGQRLLADLKEKQVDCQSIIVDCERPTTLKTRIIAHSQQVVRVDYEVKRELGPSVQQELVAGILNVIPAIQAVVISDYAKGVVSPRLINDIINTAHENRIPVIVDPQVTHFKHYKKVTVITPNHLEAGQMSGIDIVDDASLVEAGKHLLALLDCEAVLITRGEEGMALFRGDEYIMIPTVAREVYDVTGAGDTVTGVFALAISAGASLKEAAFLANHAAGIAVAEVGAASVKRDDLLSAVKLALGQACYDKR